MLFYVLLRSSVATVIAWCGGLTGAAFGTKAKSHLILLVSASLGALLAVTVLDILPDSKKLLSLFPFILSVFSGAATFFLVGKYVYPICPACADSDGTILSDLDIARTAMLLMVTLGLHSFMDGAAVVVADRVVGGNDLAVILAVSLHKYPEGLALVLLLIGAGFSRRRALFWTVAIEATTEVGALVALMFVSHLSKQWLGFIFANIGGGFLYLVVGAFASQVHEARKTGGIAFQLLPYATGGLGFAAAATIMMTGEAFGR